MKPFARRLVLILAVLAFAAGLPLALAVPPALAAEPCPHHHDAVAAATQHQHHAPRKPEHRHDAAVCLCCCIGACVSIPDLARGVVIAVPYAMAAVVYSEAAAPLTGRSVRPDPAPPRANVFS